MIVMRGRLSKNFSQEEYHAGSATVPMYAETIVFIRAIQAFRKWLNAKMYVVSWFRTKEENMKVGGIANSNHLNGTAMDFHLYNQTVDKATFIKWSKKWAAICRQYGCVGEAGLYTNWVHLGIQNSQQAIINGHKFYHWDSRSGKQINLPFPELYDI